MRFVKKVLPLLILAVVAVAAVTVTHKYSTIARAQEQGRWAKLIEEKGNELGLNCLTETEACVNIIARAEKNRVLKQALVDFKAAGIYITPEDGRDHPALLVFLPGYVAGGSVVINTWRSDKAIIDFLTD